MTKDLFHKRLPFRALFLAAAVAIALLAGCSPAIGDECESSGDCPTGREFICDNTVPGGYCTISGCRIGECPDASVCVIFDRNTSFCMASCEGDDECREDLVCRKDQNFEDEPMGYCYVPARAPQSE
jgi:hypothetical protein